MIAYDPARYDPRLRYMLDADMQPVPTYDIYEYFRWKNSLPKDKQTGIGMQVARTTIGDITVSTVYLGSDHRFGEDVPILWETMIFGGPHDEECIRYASHADALAGHDAACKKYLPDEAKT